MNIRNKNKLYILFLVLFAFAVPVTSVVSESPETDFDVTSFLGFDPQELRSNAPKISSYYNLTGSTIIIDDSDPNYNWSKTAAENPWCSGSGTLNDPYIIENVYIDGDMSLAETPGKQHSANCLSIYRSTAYFIVRECYFTKSGTGEYNSGIYLAYSENGIIYNNTFSFHNQAVMVNDFSSNITIFYNVIEHNTTLDASNRALYLEYSEDNLIVKNLVINCGVGIQVYLCVGTEIRQNFLNSSLFGAPILSGMHFWKVNNSKITYNVLAGDYTGTSFEVLQEESSGNIIENNTITGAVPIGLGTPTLHTSGDYTDLIKLTQSHFNEVKHNVVFVPGYIAPAPDIPSYNIFIVLGAIGLVSALLVARTKKKKRNHN